MPSHPHELVIEGDATDIYLPSTQRQMPAIILLQGFEIEKSEYQRFATRLTNEGFPVLIPNHRPPGRDFIATETSQTTALLRSFQRGTLRRHLDEHCVASPTKLALLGHSSGGLTTLEVIRDGKDIQPVIAGITYGSQLGSTSSIHGQNIPVAFLTGNKDGIVHSQQTHNTYEHWKSDAKVYLEFNGLTHYGITNTTQPTNGPREETEPIWSQERSTDILASCATLFLKGFAMEDNESQQALTRLATSSDVIARLQF